MRPAGDQAVLEQLTQHLRHGWLGEAGPLDEARCRHRSFGGHDLERGAQVHDAHQARLADRAVAAVPAIRSSSRHTKCFLTVFVDRKDHIPIGAAAPQHEGDPR